MKTITKLLLLIITILLTENIYSSSIWGGVAAGQPAYTVNQISGWTKRNLPKLTSGYVVLTSSTDFVGIGFSSPTYKLMVNGDIFSTKFFGPEGYFNNIIVSTSNLRTDLTTLSFSTGILENELNKVKVSTGILENELNKVKVSTGILENELNKVKVSTGTLVTLNTQQTINGKKTFSSEIVVSTIASPFIKIGDNTVEPKILLNHFDINNNYRPAIIETFKEGTGNPNLSIKSFNTVDGRYDSLDFGVGSDRTGIRLQSHYSLFLGDNIPGSWNGRPGIRTNGYGVALGNRGFNVFTDGDLYGGIEITDDGTIFWGMSSSGPNYLRMNDGGEMDGISLTTSYGEGIFLNGSYVNYNNPLGNSGVISKSSFTFRINNENVVNITSTSFIVNGSIFVTSSITVNGGFYGDGSGLTNIIAVSTQVPASGVQAGTLGSGVIASSIAVNAVHTAVIQDNAVTNAKVASIDASKITSGNLAIARMPTGGNWAISSNLSIAGSTFVVTTQGNVGIGTTSPGAKLDVRGSTTQSYSLAVGTSTAYSLVVSTTGNVGIGTTNQDALSNIKVAISGENNPAWLGLIGRGDEYNIVGSIAGYDLDNTGNFSGSSVAQKKLIADINFRHVGTAGTYGGNIVIRTKPANSGGIYERMVINHNGNVGIGTTNPGYRLQVGVSGDGSSAIANAWNTFSDIRLKTSITPLTNVISKINNINTVRFNWKDATDTKTQIGFIAQEVEAVFPELVSEGGDGYKSLDYSKFTVILLEAIKEQQKQIEELITQINQLRERLRQLE